jgi:predicted metalloenzyme YecM
MTEKLVRNQAQDFLKRAFAELEQNHFTLDEHWHIDHLCYRTSTQENYIATKRQFELFSKLLIESEVNGRLISTFKLPTPIIFKDWEIDLIEVPAPKLGKITTDGFEHFEVVCDLTFDEIKSRYAGFQFDESGLAKAFNQELEFSFNGFALKFHPMSLESVVNVEANPHVFSALHTSNILKILKPFRPLVAGTFPLNINVADSDIDILISTKDLGLAKKTLIENFGDAPNFNAGEILVKGEPTLVISFSYQGMDFEIFGQRTPSIKQQGYLHFLIEERLLKIGGSLFAEKIKQVRAEGLKTEPAFAKVLGLKGDPFEELLILQKQSNAALKALLS